MTIALAVSVLLAAVFLVLIYLVRAQGGMIGEIGAFLSWPVWWIEVLLSWATGLVVGEWVVQMRHRIRYRQLRDHLRGGRG